MPSGETQVSPLSALSAVGTSLAICGYLPEIARLVRHRRPSRNSPWLWGVWLVGLICSMLYCVIATSDALLIGNYVSHVVLCGVTALLNLAFSLEERRAIADVSSVDAVEVDAS